MCSTHYSCQFLIKCKLSQHIFEKYSNVMKTSPVGTELFCADGLIDMMKLIVTFHNFLKVSNNWQFAIDCAQWQLNFCSAQLVKH